jgi:hypothetical protein
LLPLANVFASANQNEKKHSLTPGGEDTADSSQVESGVKDVLRVDKKFRTYGPDEPRREYHKRPSVEAVYSFLKTQYSMATNKVRGLSNVVCYALYSILCLVLNREAAQNIGRVDKAVSPTYFNT